MKKILLLIVFIIAAGNYVKSQITKSNWMIGGSGSFRSSNFDFGGGLTSRQNVAQLSGDVAYFIIDKFCIGLKPGYGRTENTNPHNTVNTYEIGPLARYYFLPTEKHANIFSEISYQYGMMKSSQGVSQNSNNFSGALGCAVFFNSSVGLEFTLGYSSYLYNNNLGKVNSITFGVGFHFFLEKDN